MRPGMPEAKAPKLHLGVHARLAFPDPRDEGAVLDPTRRLSSATRCAQKSREELKRAEGPLCALFRLNTRWADG